MYDSDYREADVSAVDTATALTAQGADTPGAFEVPTHAKAITEILIATGIDWTADSILGFSSAVHLSGSGVQLGEGWFPGPFGSTAGTTNVSPGLSYFAPVRYQTNIPVNGGGSFNVDGFMTGEDCGNLHVLCQIVYDGPPGHIKDMDYREENLTAANTLVSLQARGGTASGDFKVGYSHACEVWFGAGLKAVAGPLRFAPALHLSGPALLYAGNYKFIGPAGGVQDDIASLGHSFQGNPLRFIAPITLKVGNQLRAQAQMIEDDAGTGYAVVGIGYG